MLTPKRVLLMKQRRSRRSPRMLSLKNVLQILSALIIPITLGLFVLIFTILQHQSAQRDRRNDLDQAKDLRNEDLHRFELQRREERNESRLQREHEWNLTLAKQIAQNNLVLLRHQDLILREYLKDIGGMIKEHNGSFTSNPMLQTLVHVKTLNALRQLDGSRQVQIVYFLQEIERLTKVNDLVIRIMSTIELTNIDFHDVTRSYYFGDMAFARIRLRNCTFATVAIIDRINFIKTTFDSVNFSSASIKDTDFSLASFRNVDFTYRHVENTPSASFRMYDVLRKFIFNTNFSAASFRNVDFSYRDIGHSNFSSTGCFNVDFSSTIIRDTDFVESYFFFSDFSLTKLENINFSSACFFSTDFSSTKFNRSTFSFSKLSAMDFSSAEFIKVNFTSVQLDEVKSNSFIGGKLIDSIFIQCNCPMADFSYSNLSGSVFVNANLKDASFRNADLSQVDFSGANLQNVDLMDTTISDSQLKSARSIQNAMLPNGTLGRDRNLIENGNAQCDIANIAPWFIQNGHILIMIFKEDRKNCRFVLHPNSTNAMMSQRISLTDVWDGNYWTNSSVELEFRRSSGISLELYGRHNNGTILNKEISNTNENKITMKLEENIKQLEVIVRFDAQSNHKYVWCDDIELSINYNVLERYVKECLKQLIARS